MTDGKVEALHPGHADRIHAVAFSSDGKWLATGSSDETVALWNVEGRARERIFRDSEFVNVSALVFSPDSQILFAATTDQNIRAWNLAAPEHALKLRGHSAGVNALAFAPGGPALISAGRDGTARRWRTDSQASGKAAELLPEFERLKESDSPPALAACRT